MLIPYLGEKSKFSNFILPRIPESIDFYVEPFGGMFGIYFCMDLSKYQNTKFIYNDVNYLNFNLFKHLKNSEFISYFLEFNVTEDYYEIAKSNINNVNDFNKALYWLIILTCSKSQANLLDGVWSGDQEFEIMKIKIISNKNYLENIHDISNIDYKEIIKKYDSKDTFFYMDPPYFGKEKYYLNHDFIGVDKHHELSQVLKNIKGKFALSYIFFDQLEDWYTDQNMYTIKNFMGHEVLITNY